MNRIKKLITGLLFLLIAVASLRGQATTDPMVSKCLSVTGADATYLKDFRIQLGEGTPRDILRYKENMFLWKNTKYRFTMCNADNSKGQLVLTIMDDANNVVLCSSDTTTGKIYPFVDFICNKSIVYQIYFDFSEGKSGTGVSIVSMIK